MDLVTVGIIGIAILFILLAVGAHVGIALAVAGVVGVTMIAGFEQAMSMSVTGIYHKVSTPALIALPLFIMMGHLASGGGISKKLFDSLSLWLGKYRSGMGIATVLACTGFGAVCGSSLVTAAVFTKICAPEMRRYGYSKSLSHAICAAAGSIGMLIPPSILAIVYGMLSGVSIGKLLIAGIVPGLLWAVLFCINIIIAMRSLGRKEAANDKASRIPLPQATWHEKLASLRYWWPILVVGLVIFGGIYGGIFTHTEAAAVSSFILIILYFGTIFIQRRNAKGSRETNFSGLYRIMVDTAVTSALIFFVLGAAAIFSNYIVLTGISDSVAEFVKEWNPTNLVLVIVFCSVYLVLGCFLDSVSMLAITIPVFNPIINAAGVDPIWYATLVISCIEVGLITPPVGLNIYATAGVAEPDVRLEDVIKGVTPFFIAELIGIAILFAFPGMCTFLPALMNQ